MRRKLLVALAVLGAILPALGPSQASASRAVLPGQTLGSFAVAPVVFVGIVPSTSNGDREATVKVESVWRGPDMLTYVRVVGTPEPGAPAISVDRTYQSSKRYLFVPENSSSTFQDNSCTATQVYTSALASRAPVNARAPQPGGGPGALSGGNLLPWIGAGMIMLLAAAGLIVWRWRLRRTPSGVSGPSRTSCSSQKPCKTMPIGWPAMVQEGAPQAAMAKEGRPECRRGLSGGERRDRYRADRRFP